MMDEKLKAFTESELQQLIVLACAPGATKEQILLFVNRCAELRTGAVLLGALLSGKVKITGYTEDDFIVAPA